MRRSTLLLIVVALLAILAGLVWSNRGTSLSGSDKEFSFDPETIISRIEISSPYSKVVLEKDDKWMAGGIKVDQQKVTTLIRLSSQVHAASPVSNEMQDKILEKLKAGRHISIYSGRKKVISYDVCRHNQQLYALRSGKKKSYRIEIRGYSNTDLYSLLEDNPENWQSPYILNRRPEEIREIRMYYFQDPAGSFRLSVSDEDTIRIYDHLGSDITGQADPDLLNEYLYFFSYIPFEQLTDSLSGSDTTLSLFSLEITCRNGSQDLITGYQKYLSGSDHADPVFFIGIPKNKHGVNLRFSEFDPILLPMEYFLKK